MRPNLVCRYRGRDSSRTLWIMTHLDVVPPGDLALWRSDPYVLHVEDGKLYGRGVEDNQQGLVASILCVKALMDAGMRPPVDLGLLFCADEETGCALRRPPRGGAAPGALRPPRRVPGAGRRRRRLPDRGGREVAALVEGDHARPAVPRLDAGPGRNAFRAASDLVVQLGSLYRTFNRATALFDPPISTFEPTKKEANVPNVNTIPGDDVFYVDCGCCRAYPLAEVEDEIRRLADEVAARHGVTFTFDVQQEAQAAPPTARRRRRQAGGAAARAGSTA